MKKGQNLDYKFPRNERSKIYNYIHNNFVLLDNGIPFKVPTLIKVVDWTKIEYIEKLGKREGEICYRDENNKKQKIKVVAFSRNSKLGYNFDTSKCKVLYLGRCKIY